MEQALRARALADAGVEAIVGTRVDWGMRNQADPLPAVTLQIISDDRPQHLKGFQPLRMTRVQATCWADEFADAKALAEALIAALVPEAEEDGVRFNRAGVEGPRTLTSSTGLSTDTRPIDQHVVDFLIWHSTI